MCTIVKLQTFGDAAMKKERDLNDRRHSLEAITKMLNKFRDEFTKDENTKREQLKERRV